MPRIQRSAHVEWRGNVARGGGRIAAGTGAFADLPYSLPTRIAAVDGKTSPEELLAAAHAACYAMSLAGELASAGKTADSIEVRAVVTLDEVDGGSHRIVASDLDVRARIDGDRRTLEQAAAAADEGCSFSALLKASATVTVKVEIEGGAGGD